jgi:23S rRNA (uracil1939-C5)-methyltransferase
MSVSCSYASLCSGCDWLLKPYAQQRQAKIDHLRGLIPDLPEIDWLDIAPSGLRDRADLMFDTRSGRPRLGLFDRYRSGLVDLEGCPQMSAELEAWLRAFRRFTIPIERGSVRLRVAPTGMRGVWLDFANVDIKSLLDERTLLDSLRAVAIVEIGQKRKRLVERESLLKLAEPVLEAWFETYIDSDQGERVVPLHCTIGSFTQPGFRANRALVGRVREYVRATKASKAAEFGSGIGNFTFPLASVCSEVHAYEIDALALAGLRRSLEVFPMRARIEIHEGNFQVDRKEKPDFSGVDLIMVDPPRSGLMRFLDPLEAMTKGHRPPHIIYVSCFAESFAIDHERLRAMGYIADRVSIVDQFPQSRHYEIVASYALR